MNVERFTPALWETLKGTISDKEPQPLPFHKWKGAVVLHRHGKFWRIDRSVWFDD